MLGRYLKVEDGLLNDKVDLLGKLDVAGLGHPALPLQINQVAEDFAQLKKKELILALYCIVFLYA